MKRDVASGALLIGAALASGFVAPSVMQHMVADGSSISQAFLEYSGIWNQAFAKVGVVATAASMILWSVAIIREPRVSHGPAVWGLVVGTVTLAGIISGHLRLTLHGFGAVFGGQSVWLVWLGILMCRGSVTARKTDAPL